ncbi:MAG: hypothetical protein C4308_09895 [Chitinophagaceae bacterium]
MNPKFFHIILSQVRKSPGREDKALSAYRAAKRARLAKKTAWRNFYSFAFILTGVASACFGLRGFLLPNKFIDGGVTGISLLVNIKTQIPLAALIFLINIPFLFLAFRQFNVALALRSILAISMLAIAVAIIPNHAVTDDKLLVSVFGGFFLGAGIGLAIRGGGVIDGTEILAIFLNRKSILSVGDFILIFNILIFFVAAYLLSVEVALYSILTYLAASKTVDFILEGIEEFTGVTIISHRSRQIAEMIKTQMGRGLTIYTGKKGFGKSGESYQSTEIIFTVVTRLEISRLTSEIDKIDPNAFVVMQSIKDTRGGMVKKRPLH